MGDNSLGSADGELATTQATCRDGIVVKWQLNVFEIFDQLADRDNTLQDLQQAIQVAGVSDIRQTNLADALRVSMSRPHVNVTVGMGGRRQL